MVLSTLKLSVPSDRRAGVVEVLSLLLGPVRVEPGCHLCMLYQAVGNDDDLLYVEEWETPEELERHMRSAHYERLLAVMEASDRPPVLQYCSIVHVKGLEYLEAVRLGTAVPPDANRE
jgi:quinol monooxygenase YgiN